MAKQYHVWAEWSADGLTVSASADADADAETLPGLIERILKSDPVLVQIRRVSQ
jgi:hypothetical protein